MSTRRHIALAAVAVAALTALTGCSSPGGASPGADAPATITLPSDAVAGFTVPGATDKGGQKNPVKIGVVGAGNQQFQILTQEALAEGIHLTFLDFTDYVLLNPSLTSKELDLNQFQHISYLAKYNVNSHENLLPIGSTAIYPLGLYSKKYASVADIPAGATVAIPDDQTNQARGLQVLQSAGLIQLKPGTPSLFGQVSDIDASASSVKVIAISADQTARSLDDPSIAGAIINNDYIADTGLSATSAIAQDDPSSDGSAPYINVWVARPDEADLPVYAEIVRLAHTDAWDQALLANSGGTGVLVNETPSRLQSVLADVTAQLTAS
ncbi:MAG: MetQ/NlpA family ABC transporter substrate-binding protein [Propionibacteriaceae bacterium]|nr:MetQ/NlpA family ABC transporter substrate-binding protein [Propionibacteriaceae bacterium]